MIEQDVGGKMHRLAGLRETEELMAHEGIFVPTLRSWIYTGKGGNRLKTYRAPGEPHTVLVDIDEVAKFRDMPRRKRQIAGSGNITLSFKESQAILVRELARRYADRLGVDAITVTDAIVMSAQETLRRLPAPTAAKEDE